MAKAYKDLNFAEKAIYHVRQAERYQERAEALEAQADERSGNSDVATVLLEKDGFLAGPYRRATGNRNGHQERAKMYSLIAILEKLDT